MQHSIDPQESWVSRAEIQLLIVLTGVFYNNRTALNIDREEK